MSIISSLYRYFTDKNYRFLINSGLGLYNSMPDEKYLKKQFKVRFGYELNLDNPQTFNEKLQWIKLYDRNPLYTELVDKYKVKKYVADKIGSEYIIPLLGVWDSPDEIDFDKLPNQFVLKCNHNSGVGMCICKDKSKLDVNKVRAELKKGLKDEKFLLTREWPYKNVERKIIAEEYMEDEETHELRDYKFFSFNGEVKFLFIASERQTVGEETRFDFFDENGKHLPFTNGHPNADVEPKLPKNFEKMKELAGILSEGIPEVRVDFYEVNGKVYFGEMTFFHWSGFVPFEPNKWDKVFGEWIRLPKKHGA